MTDLNSDFIDSQTGYSIRAGNDFAKIFGGLPLLGPLLLPLAKFLGGLIGSILGALGHTVYYVPLIKALPDQVSKIFYELVSIAYGFPFFILKPFGPLLFPVALILGFVLSIPAALASLIFGLLADVLGVTVFTGPL